MLCIGHESVLLQASDGGLHFLHRLEHARHHSSAGTSPAQLGSIIGGDLSATLYTGGPDGQPGQSRKRPAEGSTTMAGSSDHQDATRMKVGAAAASSSKHLPQPKLPAPMNTGGLRGSAASEIVEQHAVCEADMTEYPPARVAMAVVDDLCGEPRTEP